MNTREFVSIFTSAAVVVWLLNILWIAVLAAPVSWLWNLSVTPLFNLPSLSYGRALGLLRLTHVGLKLSAKSGGTDE